MTVSSAFVLTLELVVTSDCLKRQLLIESDVVMVLIQTSASPS